MYVVRDIFIVVSIGKMGWLARQHIHSMSLIFLYVFYVLRATGRIKELRR
jgi:hypothetical protein